MCGNMQCCTTALGRLSLLLNAKIDPQRCTDGLSRDMLQGTLIFSEVFPSLLSCACSPVLFFVQLNGQMRSGQSIFPQYLFTLSCHDVNGAIVRNLGSKLNSTLPAMDQVFILWSYRGQKFWFQPKWGQPWAWFLRKSRVISRESLGQWMWVRLWLDHGRLFSSGMNMGPQDIFGVMSQ